MENFTPINNNILKANISGTAFKVYFLLESMCYGEKDSCFPSQSYIAEQLHICTRTVQRAIKELVQAKLISVKRRGSISNLYYILNKVATKATSKIKDTVKKVKSAAKSKIGEFNNFKQRTYDFTKLERELLGWDDEEDLKE
ncbi:helix-turn-helix domain-containing protein [Clostridium sp. WILCCON 0269]|uniref:Helix-turn-helix domain-containing protein n=1 Tax=Candidatus Clostridium eludens TaxID=3381663 RepID=A0ABW8SQY5_9CLOT